MAGWEPRNQGGNKHGNGNDDQWTKQWNSGTAKQRGHDKFNGNNDPRGQSAWKKQCSGFAEAAGGTAAKAPPPDHGKMQFQVKCNHAWTDIDDESNEVLIRHTGFFSGIIYFQTG